MLTKNQINAWVEMQKKLTQLKAEELHLRKIIVSEIHGSSTLPGSKTAMLFDMELKATQKILIKLDKGLLIELIEASSLTAMEQACIKWTPSVIAAKFNKVPSGLLTREVVTLTPSAPTLSLVSELG